MNYGDEWQDIIRANQENGRVTTYVGGFREGEISRVCMFKRVLTAAEIVRLTKSESRFARIWRTIRRWLGVRR